MSNALKNTLLVLSSSLVALLLAEVAARVLFEMPSETMDTFNVNKGEYYRGDPELGWVPIPNTSGAHDRPGIFSSTFATNSFGMRDREYDERKPSGYSRLIVVGDSFAWGFGVSDGEVFTDVLEESLDGWEVLNLGVTAYSLRQESKYFERLGMRFEPDVLLVALTQNDLLEGLSDFEFRPDRTDTGTEQVVDDTERDSTWHAIKAALAESSALYGMLARAVTSNPSLAQFAIDIGLKEPLGGIHSLDNNIAPALREYPPELNRAWSVLEDDLRELQEISKRRNVPVIIAAIPALQSVDESALQRSLAYSVFDQSDLDIDKPYYRLEELCEEMGFAFVNPLGAFRDEFDRGQELYLPGDMHFNPAGHRFFAEYVLQYLNKSTPP